MFFSQVHQATINFEQEEYLLLGVRCQDDGHPTLSIDHYFNITVININEAPDDIAMSKRTVKENEPPVTLVANISTSDPDNEMTIEQVGGHG